MDEQKNQSSALVSGADIDAYTIVKDVLKNWWIILAVSLSAALLTYVQAYRSYRPAYSIEATYVVTAKGMNNSVFNNLSTAQDIAARFSQIINSPTLLAKVAEEMGTDGVEGTVSSEIVPETNLLTLRVTAKNPRNAYGILRSVMKNYPTISDYLVGNAVMDVLMAPVIPSEPDQPLEVAGPMVKVFAFTAVALTALLAVLSFLKDTIRKSADVEKKLDTRLLGVICHEEKNKTFLSKFKKNNTALLVTSPTMSFRYTEMFQKVCRKLQNRLEQKGAKTVLVTSYLENEGKSTVAANLALTLAQNGKKTILVDLDLRKPSQYKIFDMFDKKMEELGSVLDGDGNAVELIGKMTDKDLYTLFNTVEYTRSTEMLTTGRMKIILDYLKEKFDYVIMDTPPMAYVADTEEIANLADASVLVVREHMANAKDINDTLDVLNNCKGACIGCVFNDAHHDAAGTLFGGTGHGYGYGGKYGNYYGKYYGKYYNGSER